MLWSCMQGYPCKETCDEIEEHCSRELLVSLEFNLCGFFPLQRDDLMCFRPEAKCEEPTAPTYGSVEFTGTIIGSVVEYGCNFFHHLEGDQSRTCQVWPCFPKDLFLSFKLFTIHWYLTGHPCKIAPLYQSNWIDIQYC